MFLFTFFLFASLQGWCQCLGDVSLRVMPQEAVERGSSVTLVCLYNLEHLQLYMVNWNRGNRQVYRYLPFEKPHSKIFPYPGITIDVSMSNATHLVIRDVSFNASGRWSCEVTTEGPNFSTASASAIVTVVELSDSGPDLWSEKGVYEAGDILRANCTSGASKPPTNLTFTINGRPATGKVVRTVYGGGSRSLDGSWAWLESELGADQTRRGFLVVECKATVAGAHPRTATLRLPAILKEPRPQRVRFFSSSGTTTSHSFVGFIFCLSFATR